MEGRSALHGEAQTPAYEGEAEEEQCPGEGARRRDRDDERDKGGD